MTQPEPSAILEEQAAYYRARAPEYDEWWRRQGRYDHGAERNAQWHSEAEEIAAALREFAPAGDVLELAAGTGWWTERLAQSAKSLTCVDASPEVLARNRQRLAAAGLPLPEYVQADLFSWAPARRYDVVFFSFWLSHVPKEKFAAFWAMVAGALKPGGRVFLIDSLAAPSSTAADQSTSTSGDIQKRLLNDGKAYRVVKLYYQPATLARELARLGWEPKIKATAAYFLYGSVTSATTP